MSDLRALLRRSRQILAFGADIETRASVVAGIDAALAEPVFESVAYEEFERWFVTNYPGPDTIIHDPKWHAPKIYRAAHRAVLAAATEMPE